MKLYGYWRSSSSWRVRIGCAYKGLDWTQVEVNLREGAQHGQPFLEKNPSAQVPVLTFEEDHRLTQSVAILEYLEDRYPNPPLLPGDSWMRARVREAAEIINSGIQPLQNFALLKRLSALGVDQKAWAREVIGTGLNHLEERARSRPGRFFVGETVTLADVLLVPQLYNARRFGCDLTRWPSLLGCEEAALRLPAFRETHPDHQEHSIQQQMT